MLNLQEVASDDNFFELGGDSLLATQTMSRNRNEFLVEMPLRTFFEAPTIAELAEAIEKATSAGMRPPAMIAVSQESRRVSTEGKPTLPKGLHKQS